MFKKLWRWLWRWFWMSLLSGLCPVALAIGVEGNVRAADGALPEGGWAELVPLPENVESNRQILAGRVAPEPVDRSPLAAANGGGRFRLEAPGPGLYSVVVRVPGHVAVRYTPLVLVEPTELPPVVVPRDAGAPVAVTGAAGEPLADVWVLARSAAPAKELWRAQRASGWTAAPRLGKSGADGTLILARRENELLDIDVFAPGTALRRRFTGVEGLRVGLAPETAGRDLWLRGAGAGVVVCLGDPPWPAGVTDEDGHLHLAGRFSEPTAVRWMKAGGAFYSDWLKPGQDPVVLDAPEPRRFAGRLMAGEGGRPLAGALVWPLWDPGAFVLTGPRGGYELPWPELERFTVQGEASGFVPQSLRLTAGALPGGQAPDLALAPASSLGGKVVDAAGRPVPGVQVEARTAGHVVRPSFLRSDRAEARASTDAAGRFRLSRLSGDTMYALTAAKEGFFPDVQRVGGLRPGRRRDGLRFVLVANRPAFGHVLDLEERPIAGAEVHLAEPEGEGSRKAPVVLAETDAAGRFEVAAFPAPRVDLKASKDGFAPLVVPGLEVLAGDGPMDLGTLLLEPGVSIEGRVVDTGGEAVADAKVWIAEEGVRDVDRTLERLSREDPAAVSGNDGVFRVGDLEAGRRTDLVVYRDGYLAAAVEQVEVPSGTPLEVVLEAAAGVSGRVVDGDGQPVAGAEVTVSGLGPAEGTMPVPYRAEDAFLSGVTDGGGFFDIVGLADGEYDVDAYAEGFQPSATRRVRVTAGVPAAELVIRLTEGAVLEGRVLDQDGEGVAGVRVTAGRPLVTSEGDGSYRVAGVVPGRCTVEAWHPGFNLLRREVEVEPGTNVLDLVFEPSHSLEGRVVDSAGTPVADVLVTLTSESGHPLPHRTLSDDEGRFSYPRLGEGRYLLEAERPGFTPREPERLVELGGDLDGVEVVMTASAVLEGEVLGLKLADFAEVELRAANDDGRPAREGKVSYDGRYEIDDLAPGDYLVSATLDGGERRAEGRAVLEPGGRHVLNLTFEEGLVLSGQVLHGAEPVDAASIEVVGFDVAARRQVKTDHEGRFRIEALEPGRYRLSVASFRDLLIHNQDLELAGDRDLLIELATGSVGGRVVSDSGESVGQALVSLRKIVEEGPEGSLFALGSRDDGSFRFDRLTAGRYRLNIRKDGYALAEDVLEVASGDVTEGLRYVLERTSGLEVALRLASGGVPRSATLTLLDASGRQVLTDSRTLDAAGRALFPTVPPGSWELLVTAPEAASRRLAVEVPGEPLDLVLADAGRLRVRVPSLLASPRVASLRVVDAAGESLEATDDYGAPVLEWPLSRGTVTVDGVPAGRWRLEVSGESGLLLTGVVETPGTALVEVNLD